MPEEELEAQNTSEQTEVPAQPEGGEGESTLPEEAPVEDKKQRDFEAGMHKWRDRAKSLEEEVRSLKTAPQTQTSLPEDEQEPMEVLRSLIREEFAPIRSELDNSKRELEIDRVGKMPYTADFADEIVEEAKTLPKEWSFGKRLEQARATVIANNLDTIISTNKQAGVNEAYEHQAVKGVKTLGAAPAKQATGKSLLERFENQELSPEELRDNWDEISKLREGQIGV